MIARQPPPSRSHEHVYRRRRAVAGIVTLALLALLIAAISSHGGNAHTTAAATHAKAVVKRTPAEAQALTRVAEEKAVDHVLSYTPAIRAGGAKGNEVALTFDDGPGPYTQQLVTELNKLGVHATFFAIGNEERYFSPGTLLELRSGEVVGDHTESHPMMATLSAHDQYEQLFEQIARIELLDGPRPRLFRPPYGSFNATTYKLLHKLHLLMVLWSTDTEDYRLPGVAAIVQNALAGAHPGAIILMHDGGGDRSQTIAALPAIVSGLRKKGLHPVTIPRLMLDDPPPPGQPLPTSLAGD
ncbi:MAG TPA: polysaccharide deacetylase family protein [Solirubrobacteraceae bacterium]|jgi:peptidoglycan/xylan/chitin deacetylase (PgdA/CDA1 family)|nr:polysaccharide deacetylase family protein [Solirubrobacteraceae bacterium]